MADKLLIFTRFPLPGKTKTRMISVLGEDGAAALQRELTVRTLEAVTEHSAGFVLTPDIYYTGGSEADMKSWLGEGYDFYEQVGAGLGERMQNAFVAAFAAGASRVVIIGTDCPQVDARIIRLAFRALQSCDLVLGPALDGGYYLIALKQGQEQLFSAIPWGTEQVLAKTLVAAEASSLGYCLLQPLRDVDYPDDFAFYKSVISQPKSQCEVEDKEISVIIPALEEEKLVVKAVKSATGGQQVEVIVVDGGSKDKTLLKANQAGAIVLRNSRGRAAQMNSGAVIAGGSILLFLPADTLLPEGYLQHVKQILSGTDVLAGAFRLGLDGRGWGLRLIEWLANLRSKWLQIPYGDQAMFMSRDVFEKVGGFAELPLLEDLEMAKRLGKMGKVGLADVKVLTSARRWQKLGVLWTTFLNQVIILGNALGVKPETLVKIYKQKKSF